MPRSRYKVGDPAAAHFLTCTIVGWLPVFSRAEAAQIILDSWRFLQEHDRLTLYGYVIMENHVHFIASGDDLAREAGDFKSFTARQIIDLLETRKDSSMLELLRMLRAPHKADRVHQLWREESHPQEVFSPDVMRQKLEYMHNNPVRRGYVDDPVHWRHSSARNYAGLEGLIHVNMEW